MSVSDAQFWIDYYNGVKPPRREMSADAICENGGAFVTENEDFWILTPYDSRIQPRLHPKRDMPGYLLAEPYYPLALVAKWGFRVVDLERIKQLDIPNLEESEYLSRKLK